MLGFYRIAKARNAFLDNETSVDYEKVRLNIEGAMSRMEYKNSTADLKELHKHLVESLKLCDKILLKKAIEKYGN